MFLIIVSGTFYCAIDLGETWMHNIMIMAF